MLSTLEINELDNEIRKTNLVTSCEILQDDQSGKILITIFTLTEKNDSNIKDHIQELAENTFNLTPDNFMINFVRLDRTRDHSGTDLNEMRPLISGLSFEMTDELTVAKVGLAFRGSMSEGRRSLQGRNSNIPIKMFAEATLMAVEDILKISELFTLRDVVVKPYEDRQIVFVLVEVVTGNGRQDLTGSCIVQNNGYIMQAVVKATLSTINRIFPKLVADFS